MILDGESSWIAHYIVCITVFKVNLPYKTRWQCVVYMLFLLLSANEDHLSLPFVYHNQLQMTAMALGKLLGWFV